MQFDNKAEARLSSRQQAADSRVKNKNSTTRLLGIQLAGQTSFISQLLIVAPIITQQFAKRPEKHYAARVRDFLRGAQVRMIKRTLPALGAFPLNEPR